MAETRRSRAEGGGTGRMIKLAAPKSWLPRSPIPDADVHPAPVGAVP